MDKMNCAQKLFLLLTLLFMMAGCATKAPTKPVAATPEPAISKSVIHEVAVSESQAAVLVTIKGTQPLTYTSVKHLSPLGVVLYFPDTALEGVQEIYTPEGTLIKKIVTSGLEKGRASRIQINLTDDVPYEVTREENQLLVHFRKPVTERIGGEREASAAAPEEAPAPIVAEPEKGIEVAESEGPAPALAEAKTVEKPAWINRIDFVTLEGGKSRVIVGTTKGVRYETERPSDTRLLLKLFNTKIPESQKRPIITTRFNSAIDRIIPIQTAKMGDMAVIAIELREAVPYRAEQKENVFVLDFDPSTVPPRPLPDVKMPKWQQAMEETEAAVTGQAGVPSEKAVLAETGKVYTGQKISLDFQDADIRNVFRILHEISGKNFVMGNDVQGRVTLKLENVPWDQVLDLVTRMNQLGTVEEGNIVRIAPLATLEAEKKAIEAKIKAERTAIKAQEAVEPLVTEYIPINYATASDIKTHIDEIKTDRGKVTTDERTNMIIMKDTQAAIDNAKEVVKRLDVVTRQVMIEARIVEASTDFAQELGIKWGGDIYGTGHHASAETTGRLFGANTGGDYTLGGTNYAVNLPAYNLPSAAQYAAGLGFTFGRVGGTTLNLDLRLMAMETNSKGKIISMPKIATLDNEAAKIKQGYDYPFKQQDDAGNTTITWKSVDLLLEVTPHITPDNRISMEVKTTKNDLKTVLGETTIATNEAETKLLVNDGETIVIGGIIKDTLTWSEAKVPFFGDIPVLGWLFKSKYRKTEKAELLIFLTPKIIRLDEAPQVG
ncbi:MAG: hypothetical protein DRH17_09360 [Deltaproteobacteria bacterium]|nr:MAG: hypothetical protein DRH17_09360 [Deltaproteobacteria bacterium]